MLDQDAKAEPNVLTDVRYPGERAAAPRACLLLIHAHTISDPYYYVVEFVNCRLSPTQPRLEVARPWHIAQNGRSLGLTRAAHQ